MVGDRAAAARSQAKATKVSGAQVLGQPAGAHGDLVRAHVGHSLGDAAQGDGLRLGHDLLAAATRLAPSRGVGSTAPSTVIAAAWGRQARSVARGGGQLIRTCRARGKKTGPNPTDRRKAGSKHHLCVDAQGVPLSAVLTKANRNDITQLLPLLGAIPHLAGKPGRPLHKPDCVQGDRGYDSQPHRDALQARGIRTELAKRGTPHGSGLGILDVRLRESSHLASAEYTIADICTWPWIRSWVHTTKQQIGERPSLQRWFYEIEQRPAVRKAVDTYNHLRASVAAA